MTTTETKSQMPAMPPAKGGCIAYLQVEGAEKAAQFYERAFGAARVFAYPPDEKGRTMHIHLYINGSSLMLSDFYPEYGSPAVKPQGFVMTLMVTSDIDARFEHAVAAGAEAVLPPGDMFWGDRYGQVRDPFGVLWAFNQPKQAAR
jgi:uncharacterized glyoxalase superfamily protein PhnB